MPNQSYYVPTSIISTGDEPWTLFNTNFAPQLGYNPLPGSPLNIAESSFLPTQSAQLLSSSSSLDNYLPLQEIGIDTQLSQSSETWDNSTLALGSDGQSRVHKVEGSCVRVKGRRHGCMEPAKVEKIAKIRGRGACWHCRLNKIPVSANLFDAAS